MPAALPLPLRLRAPTEVPAPGLAARPQAHALYDDVDLRRPSTAGDPKAQRWLPRQA